jgi:hypothetical protein
MAPANHANFSISSACAALASRTDRIPGRNSTLLFKLGREEVWVHKGILLKYFHLSEDVMRFLEQSSSDKRRAAILGVIAYCYYLHFDGRQTYTPCTTEYKASGKCLVQPSAVEGSNFLAYGIYLIDLGSLAEKYGLNKGQRSLANIVGQ